MTSSSSKGGCTFNESTREQCKSLPSSWQHCAHIMIHTPITNEVQLFNRSMDGQTIMMQLRFDGRLGFPGGLVDDSDPSFEFAVMRELKEEMGELPKGFEVTPDDYLTAFLFEEKKYCLHLFVKEVTFEDFLLIERRDSPELLRDFEVLGVIRVPLYTLAQNNKDGFPAFLRNNFIGHCREQLLCGIRRKGLLPENVLDEYLEYSKRPDSLSNTPQPVTYS